MLESLQSSIAGFFPFSMYFVLSVVLLLLFVRIYVRITPHNEFELIAANNSAAAVAFGGALIGFALPLSSAISHSLSLVDCALWSAIALIVQISTFYVIRLMVKQISERITRGEMATGILVAASSITVGLINAACMTY
ncbi:MAG: DUF350 domain-containing protein [Moraxellaceae bacterium]|nr:MAG: DUF350 domain-containing protein [Moraxellaceae bacterium]